MPLRDQATQQEITSPGSSSYSRSALQSIQLASLTAREFDSTYSLRNVEREVSIPLFSGVEVVLESTTPSRVSSNGFYNEFSLQNLRVTRELVDASDPVAVSMYKRRQRVADRLLEQPGAYSVKYCHRSLIETDHGPQAAAELVLETKILMNLSPSHPNLLQIFAANGDGIDSFLESGRTGFFLLVDRLSMTLDQRLEAWRRQYKQEKGQDAYAGSNSTNSGHLTERLEVANDVCSALVFLASRELVYYLRPSKVGFDTRSGRLKLCEFGEARQEGLSCHSPTIMNATSTDVLAYTAPEILGRHPAPASVNADVYAFGIVLWELTTLERPFDGYSKKEHFKRVVQRHERPSTEARDSWPHEIPRLMEQCWDPNFRPTIKAVQDILEMVLLFDEADEVKPKVPKVTPSKETVGPTSSASTPQSPPRSSSVDQHLRRSTKEAHSPRSSGASVATHSTYRTRGDYSAFTNGTASHRHSQVQRQRMTRQRSMSQVPTATTGGGAFDDMLPVCTSPTASPNADRVPRQRRLSMEVARTKSRSQVVKRSRSISGEEASVLRNTLSQIPKGANIKSQTSPDRSSPDRLSPMEIDDNTSKGTTATVPSSDSSPEPALVSPDNRQMRSPRRSSFHISSMTTPSGPDSALRSAHVPHRGSRTQSLRKLTLGESFNVQEESAQKVGGENPTSRFVCRSRRRNSAGPTRRSSFSAATPAATPSPNAAFSLDNIPESASPVPVPQRTIPRQNSTATQRNRSQVSGVSRSRSNDLLQGMQANNKYPRLVSDPNQVALAAAAASIAALTVSPESGPSGSSTPSQPRHRAVQRSASSRDMPKICISPRRPSLNRDSPRDHRPTLTRSDSSTFRVAGGAEATRLSGRAPLSRGTSFSVKRATAAAASRRRPSFSATIRSEAETHSPPFGGHFPRSESFSAKLRAEMAEEMQLLQRRHGESPHRAASHDKTSRRSSKLAAMNG